MEAWSVVDAFSDTTNDEGVTTSKADNEAAYTASLDATAAASVRAERDALIKATDFYALSDVVMTTAMTTYRQALRDITTPAGFPNEITWPVAP